ncbi:MAG: hypothetical protein JXO72_08995 [Vicinamibacteria bacterium]|nr:hypothetical protein [Vicinamibacteria bacterium]
MTAAVSCAGYFSYLIGLLLWSVGAACFLRNRLSGGLSSLLAIWLLYTVPFMLIVASPAIDGWLRATPTSNWRASVKTADVAIILGFGYEKDPSGAMLPGATNVKLLDWTLKKTDARTLIVQEGVWTACCSSKDRECHIGGRTLERMHAHTNEYVNTLDAAFCAMEVLNRLGRKRAILVAHPLQLARAAGNFDLVNRERFAGRYSFIVPEIAIKTARDPDGIPFAPRSAHVQTRYAFLWRVAEIFLSRPRDHFSRMPDRCKVALANR